MKYKAVIFDLFGTLIDNFSDQNNQQILTEMALVLSLPVDDFIKLWKDSFDLRATGILSTCEANIEYVSKKIGEPIRSRAVKEATRMRFEFTEHSIIPRPYCIEVLSNLKEAGYKTGLISDCSLEIPPLWQNTQISKLIDVPVFSCVADVKKPDPRIYRMALDKLGVEAKDCLYIGDGSSNELSGAKEVGMYPVLIHVPYETGAVTYRIDAEKWEGPVISSLSEVMDLL
jgi:putative hydrolase of the HAD superfamily